MSGGWPVKLAWFDRLRVVLDFEPVLQRVRPDADRPGNDVTLHLQFLAFERRVARDFVDVLEILCSFAQRGPQQSPKAGTSTTAVTAILGYFGVS